MAILTDDQVAYLRSEVGPSPTSDALQEAYDRNGTLAAAAAELVRTQLSGLLEDPASFTLPGVLSIGSEANIRALQAKSDRLEQTVATEASAAAQAIADAAAAAQGPRRLVRTDAWR